ncbi:MAG TPA: hypothetical protein VF526_17615 [Solirubrobacteraceae bacterium]
MREQIDLAFGLLDRQLLDRDERRCGKVDDLELSGGVGKPPRVAAAAHGTGCLGSDAVPVC